MLKITFHGAVRTVTGSMHLVEARGVRILLDCGLFQGRRAEFYRINAQFPFPPSSIDAVVLSHAHLDHSGNLPTLVRQGFRGPVYCTPATRDLTALVLRDSAKVQHQDVRFVNKIRARQGQPAVAPLYTAEEANRAIAHLKEVPYHQELQIGPARVTLFDAGHILGSAIIVLEAQGRIMGFSGDLGRPGAPILRDPEVPPGLDLLLLESTYGDRRHESFADGEHTLAQVVREAVTRGGHVLIPSFALGRAQDLAYALHRLREAGQIPAVDTFVDSPMATDATEIYRDHPECFDDEIRGHLARHDPFGFRRLRYVRSVEESKQLNDRTQPFIVIATSGMCESGRILHHLRHHIGDPRSSVLIVLFQAANTLGRRLADGVSPVNIFGEPHEVRLQVHRIEAFSAHADADGLVDWVRRIRRVGRIYCIHGEEHQSQALAGRLIEHDLVAEIPTPAQQISI